MSDSRAVVALKGQDTENLLEHIAWQEVVLPRLRRTQQTLTQSLVGQVLGQQAQAAESKEQIAGKIFGIDWTIKEIERIVSEGKAAKHALAQDNLYLDDSAAL